MTGTYSFSDKLREYAERAVNLDELRPLMLRAAQEIDDLVADADAMASRIQAGDRARDDVIEECAIAARQGDRDGVEWVRDSLWAAITQRSADCVRRLKTKPLS